jgi:hypothetical protein
MEFCTCGAQLVADARFCHKCGRPVREEFAGEVGEPAVADAAVLRPPPLPPSAIPLEINFRNAIAVRIGLVLAGAALLGSLLLGQLMPGGLLFSLVFVLVTAGFATVAWYRRSTHQPLTVASGARLGWITGVFTAVLFTVLWTISMVEVLSRGKLAEQLRDQLKQSPAGQTPDAEQLLNWMQTPGGLMILLLVTFTSLFVSVSILPAIGGAIAARLSGPKSETQ